MAVRNARKPVLMRIVLGALLGIGVGMGGYFLWKSKQPDPVIQQIAAREKADPVDLQASYDMLGKAEMGTLSQADWDEVVANRDSPYELVRFNAYSAIANQWDSKRGPQVPELLDKMKTDPSAHVSDVYIWRKALARAPGWEAEAEEILKSGNEAEREYAKDALAAREKFKSTGR